MLEKGEEEGERQKGSEGGRMGSEVSVLALCSLGVEPWGWGEGLSLESQSLIQENDRPFLEGVGTTQVAY